MKIRNYEKKNLCFLGIAFLFLLEFILGGVLYSYKIEEYQLLKGFISHQNTVLFYVTKEERKMIYQNQKAYFKNQTFSYEIEEDRGISMRIEKTNYYAIIIRMKWNEKHHDNEIIELSFQKRKKRLIELFKIIWEGDEYQKNQ